MDIRKYNQIAWNQLVIKRDRWTIPVSSEVVQQAREGIWRIGLTATIPVPKEWFPPLNGLDVLCLASGGGQQGPILAATGAKVTVFDNSPKQLESDRFVAKRDSLGIRTVEGDMRDLNQFKDASFGLIVHPASNLFVPDVRLVWKEAFRVLRTGGVLLSGFVNPASYLFDWELAENTGELHVKYKIPYSDVKDLDETEKQKRLEKGEPLVFSHTLDDQIGGQIDAGFVITGFYEDRPGPEDKDPLAPYMATTIATRAVKL